MLALIDADIVCYRIGFTTENEDLRLAEWRCDEMLDNIITEVNATEFKLFLSDNQENNFRYQIDPTYKAHRVAPKPKWHEEIKEHMIVKWGATFAYGMEADDALGIEQTKYNEFMENPEYGDNGSVICSIDKDLRQIPGNHYNFVKKEKFYVTSEEGLRYFFGQILIGDSSDNIQGCRGVGPVRTGKILGSLGREFELYNAVFSTYAKQHKEWSEQQIQEHILRAGRLLKIRTREEEPLWNLPLEQQTMVQPLLSSTPVVQEENGLCTGQFGPENGGVGLSANGQISDTGSVLGNAPAQISHN